MVTGRSSGDDGGLVGIGRVSVAGVEKSVGAGRNEADAQQDRGGHGKKNGAVQTRTAAGGNLISPNSCSPWL